MARTDFHDSPFDEGTLTKLDIFELYLREWLPVFLVSTKHNWRELHVFDFFAGPGTDPKGQLGSPLRTLRQLHSYSQRQLSAWKRLQVHAHFFDRDQAKVAQLEASIQDFKLRAPDIEIDIRPLRFESALTMLNPTLSNRLAAKLLFIDQCGVDHVRDDIFKRLVQFPTCDFLFFLSSSTLNRFRDHPAIKQKIVLPDDYYHVHRAALTYYQSLLPKGQRFYLAPFSIKKGSNVYGVIFGSAHPLGMDKFLRVAWQKDKLNGEADFDINRENFKPDQERLPLDEFRPSKVTAFEQDLEDALRTGLCQTERDVVQICFDHGVTRQHSSPVLAKLKKEGVIEANFRVPDIERLSSPGVIRLRLPHKKD
jgi:three-Cys-motif partner protein